MGIEYRGQKKQKNNIIMLMLAVCVRTQELPSSIGRLGMLTILNVDRNQLSDIPREVRTYTVHAAMQWRHDDVIARAPAGATAAVRLVDWQTSRIYIYIYTCVTSNLVEIGWTVADVSLSSCLAFSALTLLVGRQEGHRPVKTLSGGCWRGCLSGVGCRLAYGPADATATHCLLLQ